MTKYLKQIATKQTAIVFFALFLVSYGVTRVLGYSAIYLAYKHQEQIGHLIAFPFSKCDLAKDADRASCEKSNAEKLTVLQSDEYRKLKSSIIINNMTPMLSIEYAIKTSQALMVLQSKYPDIGLESAKDMHDFIVNASKFRTSAAKGIDVANSILWALLLTLLFNFLKFISAKKPRF